MEIFLGAKGNVGKAGMRMDRKKFWGSFFLWCMVLFLAGCGKKGGTSAVTGSKDYVYKQEEIKIEGAGEQANFSDFIIKNGRIYLTSMEWKEEGCRVSLVHIGLDGTDEQSFFVDLKENTYLSWMNPDGEGNFYMIYDEYIEEEEGNWRDDYYLIKLDSTGQEIFRQPLSEGVQDYWVNWMRLLEDGRVAVSGQGGISFFDAEGKAAGHVELAEEAGGSVYFLQDGRIIMNSYNEKTGRSILRELNPDTGVLSGEYILPGNSGNYSFYPGAESDFLLIGNGGVYSYNLGDEEIKKIMDFIDSDMSTGYIYNICDVNEKEFYGMMNSELTGRDVLMKFTKVDPKDVADKTVLTLACNDLDWQVRKHVVEFNKTDPEYRIQITDYSQYTTEEDYSAGITRLNTDIVSGKMPDILVLNDYLPLESYMAKGLFEDLYPYIDKDGGLKREDYFPNVLKAYENDGKLYRLVPKFTIYTVAGKTADVGQRTGWTLEDLREVMASKPDGMEVFSEMTRESMLEYSIQMTGSQFIDWESGKCGFDSEEFISLLEFIKEFPETLPEDYYDSSLRGDWNSWFREGKVLLERMSLYGFSSYNYTKKGTFGEEITLIGFPSGNGKGSSIDAELEFAMSSKSKNKDGVWKFLRYFLSDEFQGQTEYEWPVSMKQVDVLAQKAKKRPSYEDENGNLVEYDEVYYLNGEEVPISPMTQEEVDEVIAFVQSVDQLNSTNQDLINIILEEAAPYFAGQKNAKEVADIIQNRVQIYVNENR